MFMSFSIGTISERGHTLIDLPSARLEASRLIKVELKANHVTRGQPSTLLIYSL